MQSLVRRLRFLGVVNVCWIKGRKNAIFGLRIAFFAYVECMVGPRTEKCNLWFEDCFFGVTNAWLDQGQKNAIFGLKIAFFSLGLC